MGVPCALRACSAAALQTLVQRWTAQQRGPPPPLVRSCAAAGSRKRQPKPRSESPPRGPAVEYDDNDEALNTATDADKAFIEDDIGEVRLRLLGARGTGDGAPRRCSLGYTDV